MISFRHSETGGCQLQEVAAECSEICSELELRQPLAVNTSSPDDVPAVLHAVLRAAAQPEKALAIPQTPSLKVHSASQSRRCLRLERPVG